MKHLSQRLIPLGYFYNRTLDKRRWRNFISLSVDERNQVTELASKVRGEMKRTYTLKELGLRGTWNDLDLNTLLSDNLLKILSEKKAKSRSRLLKDIMRLRKLMSIEAPAIENYQKPNRANV